MRDAPARARRVDRRRREWDQYGEPERRNILELSHRWNRRPECRPFSGRHSRDARQTKRARPPRPGQGEYESRRITAARYDQEEVGPRKVVASIGWGQNEYATGLLVKVAP